MLSRLLCFYLSCNNTVHTCVHASPHRLRWVLIRHEDGLRCFDIPRRWASYTYLVISLPLCPSVLTNYVLSTLNITPSFTTVMVDCNVSSCSAGWHKAKTRMTARTSPQNSLVKALNSTVHPQSLVLHLAVFASQHRLELAHASRLLLTHHQTTAKQPD